MRSLVILMIESEQPEGLSARKLVVETEKHNVLTSYNAQNGIRLLKRFPNVDAVLVHSALLEENPDFLSEVKSHANNVPIILASPLANVHSPEADYVIDSFRPQDLLKLLNEDFAGEQRN